jgi:hypothetical protein
LLLMIVGRREAQPLERHVNATQMAQSAVNLLVPSAFLGREPFPGVLPTSRLFAVVYRGQPLDYIHTWYQTDMWTLWGSSFAVGGWRGGPWTILGVAFLLGAGYRRLLQHGGRLGLLWRIWWLYCSYYVIISYGFDVDLATAVKLFVSGAVVVFLVRPRVVAPAAQTHLAPARH